ncbi:aspartate-semialdehyde dehydrogenase [Bacteroidota bacterium]
MKIAIIGATGLVGKVMINVLSERNFEISELIPVGSERSVGKSISFRGKEITVKSVEMALKEKPAIALFSAGSGTSLKWAPEFARIGTTVIDNSSAWRMEKNIPLVVPEINADILTNKDKIIANPNCSTIQMVLPLYPLHNKFGIKRLVISTYQSVSGTGIKAIRQLENERKGIEVDKFYPFPIYKNILPHCDDFTDNDYTKEEMKLINETKKILNDDSLKITATAVRVPVTAGHSESVNIEFFKKFEIEEVREILQKTNGIIVQDDPHDNIYPMVLFAEGKDEVFVGRIRRDFSNSNSLNMWVVADNLRKGAATNAVQIAEYLVKNNLLD